MKKTILFVVTAVMAAALVAPAGAGSIELWSASQAGNPGIDRYNPTDGSNIDYIPCETCLPSGDGPVIPRGMVNLRDGRMLVTDTPNGSPGNGLVRSYEAGTGKYFGAFADSSKGLSWPWAIAQDKDGFVYVTDRLTDNLHRFTVNGVSAGAVSGSVHNTGGGSGDQAEMVEINGTLYVSHSVNNQVRVFDATTGVEGSPFNVAGRSNLSGMTPSPDNQRLWFVENAGETVYSMKGHSKTCFSFHSLTQTMPSAALIWTHKRLAFSRRQSSAEWFCGSPSRTA